MFAWVSSGATEKADVYNHVVKLGAAHHMFVWVSSGATEKADVYKHAMKPEAAHHMFTWVSSGATEKADVYEHAVKLGAGPEALAGFAEGAVAEGRASSGRVYAAARRVAEAQPYSAAAHNILGLACEARGDCRGAVAAYCNGLAVVQGQNGGAGVLPWRCCLCQSYCCCHCCSCCCCCHCCSFCCCCCCCCCGGVYGCIRCAHGMATAQATLTTEHEANRDVIGSDTLSSSSHHDRVCRAQAHGNGF